MDKEKKPVIDKKKIEAWALVDEVLACVSLPLRHEKALSHEKLTAAMELLRPE